MLDDGSVEGEARLENIRELISVAQKYDKLDPGTSLSIFLEEVSLIADIDTVDNSDNAITFMTVHSAKGLEYPNVFIAGLEEGIFPHNRSLLDQSELEEERRLMYVAMTRAMERLYLFYARERMLYGESRSNSPSQFLDDLPEDIIEMDDGYGTFARVHSELTDIGDKPVPIENEKGMELELATGDKVTHGIFGDGVVIDIKGGVITVAFKDPKVGVKKLALTIAPLKKI
ncbi:hypothetical protein GF354_00305 [Candidatus Peregrinibacteria bacterium]|nr:hypothetical protein [Candidatus Peregrinibacteria bacterium]